MLFAFLLFELDEFIRIAALKKKREADIGSGADGDIIHGKLV